ncbi:hypothetical protein BCR43DRAFT_111484 [Syncephalastrum racemosum]|uniref:Protein EFR3 n=1 Tax=Syncephalastrum racemosum TaxID=13706 RepID=A0A1X2GZZ7_SYNRA|nr:hypothetical protein BCR43DRAFT_111484 [Syncephalastrum racemosum]
MSECFGHLWCVRYVKHASLVKSCYPTKEGEGPRSSELSYLTFYASARPAKLTKVGNFLLKKVTHDIARGRKQNNLVSLAILKALIQSCHHDLNLFSKQVVSILNMTLDTRDLDLIDLSCETFVVFSSYHDGSTLGVDADFTSDFEALLKRFAGFCNYDNEDQSLACQMRYIGHRGMQAAATSSALHASDFKTQVDIILPALLTSLLRSQDLAFSLAKSEYVDIRISAIKNDTLEDKTVDLLAAQSTSIIFNNASGAGVRTVLNLLFHFLDEKQAWWPSARVKSIAELLLDSLQPPYRYLLVSMLEQQIESLEPAPTPKHASLVVILETILNTPDTALPGISVLEVLNALFIRLIQMLQHGDLMVQIPQREEEKEGELLWASMIHHGLIHSMGGLASQTYYHNQLDDMTSYLVAKLRASTSLETVDGLPIQKYRHATLRCLNEVVGALGDTSPAIAASCWTPALALLTDAPETRIDFARSLVQYLTRSAPASKETIFPQTGDIVFLTTLHHTILAWVQRPDFDANDTRALYAVLCASLRRFAREAVIRAIPLVFKIQDLAKNNMIQPAPRQRAVAAALVRWIAAVADFYELEALQQYAQGIIDERREKQQWTPLTFASDDAQPLDNAEQTVTVWMDRHEIVQPLSVALRDTAEDPHGLDIESKLYVEWGSEAFISHERAPRITRDSEEHKPRLARPSPRLEMESKKDPSIKVQNLKQALVGSDENDTAPKPQRNGSLSTSKSQLRTDVSALLTELHADAKAHSTHSLVHPPYQ